MTELEKALYDCTTEEHQNKALRGVFTKDDYITASDSTVFVKVFRPFDFDESLLDRNGKLISDPYPNISGVIPEGAFECITISLSELINAAKLIPSSPDERGKRIALNLRGVCLYPPRVLKVCRIFEALGDTEIVITPHTDRIVLGSEKAVAVIMSLGVKADSHPLIENYTIEAINLMADLL